MRTNVGRIIFLMKKGFELGKNQITIKEPIKALGIYHATVKVSPDIDNQEIDKISDADVVIEIT